ncbi:MAG: hypothetical protein ACFCBU_10825 [Cyanophyceae cyanobacterium]
MAFLLRRRLCMAIANSLERSPWSDQRAIRAISSDQTQSVLNAD